MNRKPEQRLKYRRGKPDPVRLAVAGAGSLILAAALFFLVAGDPLAAPDTTVPPAAAAPLSDPIIVVPVEGGGVLERKIGLHQQRLREGLQGGHVLENLAWLFIAKARQDGDAGLFLLARRCADQLAAAGRSRESLFIRGHVHHQLHEFEEAETAARRLVEEQGHHFEYGLLGDVLLDRGKLDEAIEAYGRMMAMRPGLQAYIRAAEVRWLKGDVEGAIEAGAMAVRSGSARNPEPMAWALARLATYQLHQKEFDSAHRSAGAALELVPSYVPALAVRGRIFLAQKRYDDALSPLREAAGGLPQPKHQWALWECLHALGLRGEANRIEGRLLDTGAREDPRTLALYLASRGAALPDTEGDRAVVLARRELTRRQDVFTHDALAWALLQRHKVEEAQELSARAPHDGVADARLLYHRGAIALAAGRETEARGCLARAVAAEHMLFPSERRTLRALVRKLGKPLSDRNHNRNTNLTERHS